MKIKLIVVFLLSISAVIIFSTLILSSWPDDDVHLIMCDVGQGDATLINHGFIQVLIDGGPDQSVISCLEDNLPFWDRSIEILIITHPDKDHIGGLPGVLERYFVGTTLVYPVGKDSEVFWELRKALLEEEKQGMHFVFLPVDQNYRVSPKISFKSWLPEVSVGDKRVFQDGFPEIELWDVVQDQEQQIEEYNDLSIVTFFSLDGVRFINMGDLPVEGELSLEGHGMTTDVSLLKIGHHGSKTSTSSQFLDRTRPEISLISVGENNTYNHPNTQVVANLKKIGSQIYRTDQLGEIEVIIEGEQAVISEK